MNSTANIKAGSKITTTTGRTHRVVDVVESANSVIVRGGAYVHVSSILAVR